MSPPAEPKSRTFPPPCWTHDESHALIAVYKDRWLALGRSNLKSADWDSVASSVNDRCPLVLPPKTAIQCRHKMEKLRRRFRTEKERASIHLGPAPFFSAWDLFQPMIDLECDSPFVFGSSPDLEIRVGVQYGGGFRVRNYESYRCLADSDQNLSDPDETTPKGAGFGGGFRVKDPVRGPNSGVSAGYDRYGSRGSDGGSEFPVKSLGDRNLGPSDFRIKGYGKSNEKFNPKLISKRSGSNGVGSRSGFNQKFRGGMHSNGVGLEDLGGSSSGKGADDPIEAMASSIEFLGEVFVKMEKRKMEMAGEMAKMRMKMEMKQNQLIMESEKQMVDACVKALWETKRKKKMKVVSLDES
ncbi:hypothetical protein C1H46_023191 [Malus baccata]|uniref:Myb-like domain-containing protein n=1 Tax=Malus baccata TaxID=106549 RepID=A0A540LXG3_MALBA|nr:hypothetical protein C1H46_023191 [Malus baccata]